jgi:hypothetical protein
MSTKGRTAGLLALVMAGFVAVASPAAWADRLLTSRLLLNQDWSLQGYRGYITWFETPGPGIGYPIRTLLYRDGQVRELRLSGDVDVGLGTTPFDLGPAADGRPVAAFASCERSRRRCAIRSHDLATDQERTLKTVRAPCGSIDNVSIWRDTVAFVRTDPRRTRAGKLTCKTTAGQGWPNSSLMTIRALPRAKPKLVKRFHNRGPRYHGRRVSTVELSGRYLTWFSHVRFENDEYSQSYFARIRDRRTLRICTIGEGHRYKDVAYSGVTRPVPVGEYIVWGAGPDVITDLFRQRGCNEQSRERANEVGQLLDASTFVYVSSATGYLSLFLSEKLPSFVPIP